MEKDEVLRVIGEAARKKQTELDLSGNQLKTLPPELGQLRNLISLHLIGNPLDSPPLEIAERGIKAIRAYFKSLEGEKQTLNEVKVLLVGDGGVGKTSLVKQLLGEEFDKDEPQMHGINLKDWKVEDILIHLWDFGGQEIMHATHQFFLSKRSLYILVLDGRKDEKAEYWLKHIETFGGYSPILVVLNKIDENPGFEVNRRFLQEKYKGIKGFYRVSCAKGKSIKDFELLDTHVLEPKWVTNAVYKIINSKELAACNGVLKLDSLDEILKKEEEDDYYYPPGKYRYIIDLMKKFELCYVIDKETVLLPDLLEVQEPEFDFDYVGALKFVIAYDFLPRSVIPRFIVKMHNDIASELRWRTGVRGAGRKSISYYRSYKSR